MRITDGMMASQFLTDSNSSLGRLSKYTNQVNSTKKITNIADDPQATVMALKARNRLSSLAGYQNALNTSKSYLTEAENASSNINSILQSTYELMTSAHSGTKTQEDLVTIGEEITNLKEELFSIANTSIGTVFLFGGNVSDKPPFYMEPNGALMYNGINMSMIAVSEDYGECQSSIMESAGKINDLIAQLDTSSDYSAQTSIGAGLMEEFDNIISNLKNATEYATEYTKYEPTYPESNLNELRTLTQTFSDIRNNMNSEISQELADALDRPAQPGNNFSIADLKAALQPFTDIMSTSPSSLETTLENCELTVPSDMMDLQDSEYAVRTQLKVASATFLDVSANGLELIGRGNNNFYHLMEKCTKICTGELDSSLFKEAISELQKAMTENSTQRTKFGATLERVTLLNGRYETSNITYTQMKSDAEDVDLAQAITNMTTAKTVYNAALASGAKLLQTSLLDFLR